MRAFTVNKTLNLVIVAAAIFIASFNAVADDASQSSNSAPEVYDLSRTAIVIHKKQSSFTIRLPSNPTTGYTWLLRDYDKSLITPVKHEFEAPKKHLVGAPGVEVWVFRAKPDAFTAPHRTEIRMIYARPWEIEKDVKEVIFVVTTVTE